MGLTFAVFPACALQRETRSAEVWGAASMIRLHPATGVGADIVLRGIGRHHRMDHSETEETILRICATHGRYRPVAYRFVLDSLDHTLRSRGARGLPAADAPPSNVSGRDLLENARDLAVDRFGALARDVLAHWGIQRTDDIGEIVFHMVEAKLLRKTDTDSLDDYRDVFELGTALDERFIERLEEEPVVLPAPRRSAS
jgi:uncharacterized repeat protein (TIGR04138 family)